MKSKLSVLSMFFLFLATLLPAQNALADTGPKPSMDFQFKQDVPGEPLTITSGLLFECNQPDCSDAAPIEEVGPQGFRCELMSCSAIAYGFAPYHQIEIEFSDGQTRQSNIFRTAGFESSYTVTIRPDDLLVEARFGLSILPPTLTIILACFCGVAGLAVVTGLVIFFVRRSKEN